MTMPIFTTSSGASYSLLRYQVGAMVAHIQGLLHSS